MDWSETNSYLKGITNKLEELSDPIRIASFDLDDTLIHRPKGKRAGEKWKLLDLAVSNKIAELVEDNYIIIIFTNQSGMGSGKNFDKPKWRKAIEDLSKIMMSKVTNGKYYFAVYVAKNYDLYRKPNIGLWELMKKDLKEEFGLDKLRISNKSFFCGDAAGRISASTYKKKLYPSSRSGDFSDTDRKFALNIGINFITPEDFFMEKPIQMTYKLSGMNPKKFLEELDDNDNDYEFLPRKKEIILMVGPQGSGKTEFVKKYIVPNNYVHINQDICKTKAKCLALTKEALEEGKSVVIDNTNSNIEARHTYISLAQDYGYKHIRAIIMNTDDIVSKHLNNVRHVYSNGKIPKINDIAYAIFKKNYVKPNKYEHFDKIDTVDFFFDKEQLEDPLWRKIFMRWSEY
ncbi:mg415 protein [Tupanvirus deep ocean]|uniref:Mg415 protein n=2 Tax=Tupanvirus TaxID=2094720 RepID=A0AC62A8S3_9VIRU|nr:mg415 protein [Tupanvirus deep ocean]QKU34171.1 mg415 protein [Tupanvirus deep ocean]